jgi:hypothetical protein
MSLVTLEDFHAVSVASRQKPSIPKYEQALMRMNGAKTPPMPPASTPITDEDKMTLLDWLGAAAPAATSDEAACK